MRIGTNCLIVAVPFMLLSAVSCARVDVQPIEVKPIHITVDVNVRIDRELDDFFAFQEEPAQPAGPATPATLPTTQQATTQSGSKP